MYSFDYLVFDNEALFNSHCAETSHPLWNVPVQASVSPMTVKSFVPPTSVLENGSTCKSQVIVLLLFRIQGSVKG